ncbi:hypothetical protein BDB01DRAFT_846058 [Pilobolus umbonatus]|nr:hypothetical protein BDB01DRAFT_846058 [Pilobolus umbonatus]
MSEVEGFNKVVGTLMVEMDTAFQSTRRSQDELAKEIERLIAEVELFSDIAEPPKLQTSLDKLLECKKRVTTTNRLMQQTEDRVQRMQTELAKCRQ